MIAIIDYGMGNLRSVENALRYLKTDYCITNDAEVLRKADGWILPGVGAFADCMKQLQALGLVELLKEEVGNGTKPLLGICLGMQVLFEESEEGGLSKGLGLLKGKVVKMIDPQARIPHIGWNLLEYDQPHPLFPKSPLCILCTLIMQFTTIPISLLLILVIMICIFVLWSQKGI